MCGCARARVATAGCVRPEGAALGQLDATIVRAVLLPASMTLLGDWNWYLPKWLEWLPELEHSRMVDRMAKAPPAVEPAN
jgi:putative drug exporter of the RND superfamily